MELENICIFMLLHNLSCIAFISTELITYDIVFTLIYGIKGKDYALYESYLSNRYTKTVIYNDMNGISSDWLRVRQGVPQGSILGTLPFLLYINDLPEILNWSSTPIIFSDDTSILFSQSDRNDFNKNIHIIFRILNAWFRANNLSLNFNKTHYLQPRQKYQTCL
jgi:hypothetical protein